MKFKSKQVKGKGRGRLLGYPTINLEIPEKFDLDDGIYAVKVFINGKGFIGAMHYGPIPVFNEDEKTLEVFLIDTKDTEIPKFNSLEIEVVKFLRPVLSFPSQQELIKQIQEDVDTVSKLFS